MNNLRKLRLQKRLTLTELALKTNISKSGLSYLENEVRPFTQEHMEILTKFFNVSIDYLLGRNENNKSQPIQSTNESITPIQQQLIDATKDLSIDEMNEILNYVDYLKSKKGNK